MLFDDEGIISENTYSILVPIPRKYVLGKFVRSIPVKSSVVNIVNSYEYSTFEIIRTEEKINDASHTIDTLVQNNKLVFGNISDRGELFETLYKIADKIVGCVERENYDLHLVPHVVVHKGFVDPYAYIIASKDVDFRNFVESFEKISFRFPSFSYVISPTDGNSIVYSLRSLVFSLLSRRKMFVEIHVPENYLMPSVFAGGERVSLLTSLLDEFIHGVLKHVVFL